MAVAITGGSATVTGVVPEHLTRCWKNFAPPGLTIDSAPTAFRSPPRAVRLRAVDIIAQPYPGIPTDVQAQWTALLSVAEGTSRVEDRVFPGRFLHVAELNRLGAKIVCDRRHGDRHGRRPSQRRAVTAHDLRASAALVLAGLAADGRTIVDHVDHLDRGYERLDRKLRQLGARIDRVLYLPEWMETIPP